MIRRSEALSCCFLKALHWSQPALTTEALCSCCMQHCLEALQWSHEYLASTKIRTHQCLEAHPMCKIKPVSIIGASLNKPHIDRDSSPRVYVCMYYVSNIFTRVCRTLVPEIRVRPKILRVFQYIDVLTCMIYN